MKVQECIFLIFTSISLWAEPFAAENSQGYPLDWPTSVDFPDSSNEYDKSSSSDENSNENSCCNLYEFIVKKPDGQDVCLSQYAGKVLIIVNYASGCGFTSQNVHDLSKLAIKFKESGLKILIFPSNDFLQNFGGDIEAKKFASKHPEFEVFSEICVNGKTQHPLYKFLKTKLPGALNSKTIKWNFTKFLIDRNGCPVQRFAATESFEAIEELVQTLLQKRCY
ncbi:PREDICTED: glutathione peroxidase-like [Diuraphis noxia]|uniref:glutathione peroxidase-like n=1 Tax=Diuraphis noxia TaxID=143948 RepID=UPI000763946F|nr:PREDICTED: glutathione peroxidase-like [Diuraphis noxia]